MRKLQETVITSDVVQRVVSIRAVTTDGGPPKAHMYRVAIPEGCTQGDKAAYKVFNTRRGSSYASWMELAPHGATAQALWAHIKEKETENV